jgi:two-component system nitrate/nitrite sensor histidine kinase NarX
MLIDPNGSARVARRFGYAEDDEQAIHQLTIAPDTTPTLYRVAETRQPVIIADLNDKLVAQQHLGLGLRGSAVSVPIVRGDSMIGLINLNSFTPDFFSETDAENLRIFANQAAVAIQNARLFEQAQEAAALNERQRLARDLHDSVNQSLFSASVIAESLPKLWKRNPDKVFPLLVDLHQLMKGTLAEMRLLLWELRPSSLIGNSLDKLLAQLVTAAQGQSKMSITVDAEDVPQLPEDVHIVFYRIAQEALNNIVKHSEASEVTIHFSGKGKTCVLRVHDNGKGFDTSQDSSGLGLNNMRERARTIGAVFSLTSRLHEGTQVSLMWNYPPAQEG